MTASKDAGSGAASPGPGEEARLQVTVKLGTTLRAKAPHFAGGEGVVQVAPGGRVADVMRALGIAGDEVNLIYRNFSPVTAHAAVKDGDRVALFPPNFIHFSQFYIKRSDE